MSPRVAYGRHPAWSTPREEQSLSYREREAIEAAAFANQQAQDRIRVWRADA